MPGTPGEPLITWTIGVREGLEGLGVEVGTTLTNGVEADTVTVPRPWITATKSGQLLSKFKIMILTSFHLCKMLSSVMGHFCRMRDGRKLTK